MTDREPDRPKGSIRAAQSLKWMLHSHQDRAAQWQAMPVAVQRALQADPAILEAPPMNRAAQVRMLATLEAIPPAFWKAVQRTFAVRGWVNRDSSGVVGELVPGEEGAAAHALVQILVRAGHRRNARTRGKRQEVVGIVGKAVDALRDTLKAHVGVDMKTGETRGLEAPDAIATVERWLSRRVDREMRLEASARNPSEPYHYQDEAESLNELVHRLQFTDLLTLLQQELAKQAEPHEDDGKKSLTRQQYLTWGLLTWFEAQYDTVGQRQRRLPRALCIETAAAILGALDPDLKPVADPLTGKRPAEFARAPSSLNLRAEGENSTNPGAITQPGGTDL